MKISKGVILAGGSGSRLYHSTQVVNKHLFPIYDKPMLYYPLTTLMLAGITDIIIVTSPDNILAFTNLFKDGRQWGINISYAIQDQPNGLAHAFMCAEPYLNHQPCAVILGDNIFFGHGLAPFVKNAIQQTKNAAVFGYRVTDPERYAVIALGPQNQIMDIVEKPKRPISSIAVPGLYIYDETAIERARTLAPSRRQEFEITDLNRSYLREGKLDFHYLARGYAWFDAGIPESLLSVSEFVRSLHVRQGFKIGCPEEIAYHQRLISVEQFACLIRHLPASDYRTYLEMLLDEEKVKCEQVA